MAYVFGGSYIPLSCKLVENAIFGRNFTNEEIVKHLTGNNFQSCKASSAKDSTLKRNAAQTQIALVYFIGGLYAWLVTIGIVSLGISFFSFLKIIF